MKRPEFRVARTLWAGLFPTYLMEKQRLLPQGFRFVEIEDYDDTLTALAAGEVDANFQSLADTLPLVERGVDLRLIMASDLAVGVDGVVARDAIRHVADLRGMRIGLSLKTYPHILVHQILARHGLEESDLTLVDLKGERVPDALKKGEIDAGHTWGIHIQAALEQGARLLFTSAEYPGLLVDSLVVRREALDRSADHWRRFIQAREQAIMWWQAQPDEALKEIARAIDLTPTAVGRMMEGVTHYTQKDIRALFDPDIAEPPGLYASGRLFQKFYREHGILQRDAPLDQILHPLQI